MKKTNTILRLFSYAKSHKLLLVFGLIFLMAGTALALGIPIIVGIAIDSISYVDGSLFVDSSKILNYVTICFVFAGISSILVWISGILLSRLAFVIVRDIRKQYFDKLLALPLSYIDRFARGDLMVRMSTFCENLSEGIYQGVMQATSGISTLVVTIVCMFMLNWIVALIVIALSPISAVVAYCLAKRNRRTFKLQNENLSEMTAIAEEYIAGNRLVRTFNKTDKIDDMFCEINDKLQVSGLSSQFAGALVNPVSRIVNNAIYAIVAIAGSLIAVAYLDGVSSIVMTIGSLSAFLSYATQFAKPFNDMTSVTAELQTAAASATKIYEIIDNVDESSGGTLEVSPPINSIIVNNGSFSYSDKPFIENLNFTINNGQKVAIVGTTGSGKTTVINLIMRFYDFSSGSCTLDGADIEEYSRRSVRRSFGMVLQDTWLFKGTIRENIAYGKPDATDEEIELASKSAHLDGFINSLTDGYDTMISGEDEHLSEGQKQLITIARIILAKPKMLILDEATASVDIMTEKSIGQAFASLSSVTTTITVAHRLSTIKDYDQILVMDSGCIIESGNHEQLLACDGLYKKMWSAAGGEM